jgi:hypothetical protein
VLEHQLTSHELHAIGQGARAPIRQIDGQQLSGAGLHNQHPTIGDGRPLRCVESFSVCAVIQPLVAAWSKACPESTGFRFRFALDITY